MKNRHLKGFLLGAASLALLAGPALADYQQSPTLQAQVDSGALPPVAERVPSEPLVLQAPEVGTFGGTWRSTVKGNNDEGWIRRASDYEPLVKYTFNWDGVEPNVAKSWEVSEDGLTYTFHLREGHKWSDGKPFTSEDVVFVINDVINDPDFIGARIPALLGATAEAPDAQTVVVKMPAPHSLLLEYLASVDGVQVVHMQKEFCSQFHPKYNPDANKQATDAGLTGWGEAMRNHCGVQRAKDHNRPTLAPWIQRTDYDGINTPLKFERNPYYFKVDQAGNQLPYVDNLSMTQVEDVNSIVLMGIAGEIDITNRHIDNVANKPVFFDNQEKGGYHLYDTVPADMNTAIIQLNLNVEDEGFRELFQNKDFRVALSHAIDRQEIIDVVYAGQGEPYQAAPRPESPFYDEELAKQFTEYDPDLAEQMLDAIGLTERNSDGIRLLPDGRPVVIRMDVSTDIGPQLDIMELVALHWADIGVKLDVRKAERSYVYEQKDTNKHMAHVWKGDGGMGDAMIDSRYYIPSTGESSYAILWARNWFDPTNPLKEAPPAEVQHQLDLYKQMYSAASTDERDDLFRQVLDVTKEEFYTIGISLPPKSFGIAKNNVGNVPVDQPMAWIYPTPGPMATALIYFKQ
jgi:peptide/nickel transport system substrate-binding protein